MLIKTSRFSLFLLLYLLSASFHHSTAQIAFPPEFGQQTPRNLYRDELVTVYEQDFEGDVSGVQFLSNDVQVTLHPSFIINGARSARFFGAFTAIHLSAAETNMQPNSIYEVSFDYSLQGLGSGDPYGIGSGFLWSGFTLAEYRNLAGPTNIGNVPTGRFRRQIRTGTDASITTVFTNFGAAVVIDDIKIARVEPRLHRAEPPLHSAGFPRLANYNLFSSFETALRNGNVDLEEVESTLGLFDVVTGYQIDHTILPTDAGRQLRAINPDIRILPYHQTFVAQYDGAPPVAGVAGLLQLFNHGIQSEWFMRQPDGTLLEEPWFPNHLQMNHTVFGPVVFGFSFVDYVQHYLSKTIVPTGLWDGIQFDQSEWFPNPLLSDTNPFLGEPGPLPPIDLDNDGNEETDAELDAAWRSAFDTFFSSLHTKFGYTQLLFGNAGEIPTEPNILNKLNGVQREFLLPYQIDDDGDLIVFSSTPWHDLVRRYSIAQAHLRAPQLVNYQFTGYKLGVQTGGFTNNGLENRETALESRDFQRMRLGLTTVLMGAGFFGYDLVDNTTLPVWFDEYAVNGSGIPQKSIDHKGYLGQPLGVGAEILGAGNVSVFSVDFELPSQFPLGAGVTNFAFTEESDEVIGGTRSVVISADSLQEGESLLNLYSIPEQFSLDINTNYQLMVDYRILDVDPVQTSNAFFSIGVYDAAMTPEETLASTMAIWNPGAGQAGTLRVSTKTRGNDASFLGYLHGNGSIVLDNVRLIEGPGGVFRRDFEKGIALVNPTSSPIVVTQPDVAGPLNRTGIKRIAGVQDPATNSGAVVSAGITIPAADGIILRANTVNAIAGSTPTGLNTVQTGNNSGRVNWNPATGTVAGYWIQYGIDGGDLADFALASSSAKTLDLLNLQAGSTYRVRIASHDYLGNTSAFSQSVSFTTTGSTGPKPLLGGAPVVVQGTLVTLTGTGMASSSASDLVPPYPFTLAGVQVLVNDLPAPLSVVSPTSIEVLIPNNIGGPTAIIDIVRNGVRGPTKVAFVGAEWIQKLQTARHSFNAFDANNNGTLSKSEWTNGDMLGEDFDFLANGGGALSMNDLLKASGLIPQSLSTVYVDFAVGTAGVGTIQSPVRSLSEALGLVTMNGTGVVRIRPGTANETFTAATKISPTGKVLIQRETDGTNSKVRIGQSP